MFSPNEILDIRKTALHQAAHDCRGGEPATTVVERARVYEAFLNCDGPMPPQTPPPVNGKPA